MTAEDKLNAATNALKKVVSAVQRHLPPNGISEREAMGEIIEAVDPWPLYDAVSAESKRTAEDKIKEVMELVFVYTKEAINFYGFDNGESTRESNDAAWRAIEAKLRELIKDDE